MGMSSWICKGCGRELIMGEQVRLNGCKGEYDGYCGNDSGYDASNASWGDDNPACWHERCYQNATDAEKLDETPSGYAPNQGFGYPRAENVKEATVAFSVLAYPPYVPGSSHDTALLNQHGIMATTEFQAYEDEDEAPQKAMWATVMPNEMVEAALAHTLKACALIDEGLHKGGADDEAWDAHNKEWDTFNPLRPKVFETIEEALTAGEALAEGEWPDVAVMGVNEAGGQTGVVRAVRGDEFE